MKKLIIMVLLSIGTIAISYWKFGQVNPHTDIRSPVLDEQRNLSDHTEQRPAVAPHKLVVTRPYLQDLSLTFAGQKNHSFSPALHRCAQRLQFVVSSDESIMQAADFKKRFSQDSRLDVLPICMNQVLWVDPADLACGGNWHNEGRLGCDLQSLGPMLKELDFTHLVIFAEKGKANVHNGIMFLDHGDTYDVFIHELAHFAGFVDEYPLHKSLAKGICAKASAPNIIFKHAKHGKQASVDTSVWSDLSGSNKVAVSEARTCDNHSAQAYKPTADITFMEFHDLSYIPEVYIAAWLQTLTRPQQLTPAYINFAQLYEGQDNLIQSTYWRQRYVDYIHID